MDKNRVTLEGFSNYEFDSKTLNIYNKRNNRMRCRINKTGRRVVDLKNDEGERKTVDIDRIVQTTLKKGWDITEQDRIVLLYYKDLTTQNIADHPTRWSNRIKLSDPTLSTRLIIQVVNRLQTGK